MDHKRESLAVLTLERTVHAEVRPEPAVRREDSGFRMPKMLATHTVSVCKSADTGRLLLRFRAIDFTPWRHEIKKRPTLAVRNRSGGEWIEQAAIRFPARHPAVRMIGLATNPQVVGTEHPACVFFSEFKIAGDDNAGVIIPVFRPYSHNVDGS